MNQITQRSVSKICVGALLALCVFIGYEQPGFARQGRGGGGRPGPNRGGGAQQGGGWGHQDRDNNPPGPRGGQGTNWENRPGPQGGPGASPDFKGNQENWKAKRLERFDADKNGTLDAGEKQAGKQQWLENHPKASEHMKQMDSNGDGRIERGERQEAREAWHDSLLQRLDSNKDGTLDKSEKEAGRQQWLSDHPQAAERLKQLDAEGDGKIGQHERRERRRQWRDEQTPPAPASAPDTTGTPATQPAADNSATGGSQS